MAFNPTVLLSSSTMFFASNALCWVITLRRQAINHTSSLFTKRKKNVSQVFAYCSASKRQDSNVTKPASLENMQIGQECCIVWCILNVITEPSDNTCSCYSLVCSTRMATWYSGEYVVLGSKLWMKHFQRNLSARKYDCYSVGMIFPVNINIDGC